MEASPVNADALARLVVIVQRMVNEGVNSEGFDAHAWTVDWMTHPVPALGMFYPAEYKQTEERRWIVETLLLQIESGAHS